MNEIFSFARRVAFGRTIARDLSGRVERGRRPRHNHRAPANGRFALRSSFGSPYLNHDHVEQEARHRRFSGIRKSEALNESPS